MKCTYRWLRVDGIPHFKPVEGHEGDLSRHLLLVHLRQDLGADHVGVHNVVEQPRRLERYYYYYYYYYHSYIAHNTFGKVSMHFRGNKRKTGKTIRDNSNAAPGHCLTDTSLLEFWRGKYFKGSQFCSKEVWKLLTALFKVPNTGALMVDQFHFITLVTVSYSQSHFTVQDLHHKSCCHFKKIY